MVPGITILHDIGRPLCFVGSSVLSRHMMKLLVGQRTVVTYSLEHLEQQSKDWLSQYQYIILSSDLVFKMRAVEFLQQHDAHFFSMIHDSSLSLNSDVKIGQGTLVSSWVDMLCGEISIGDHCVLSSYIQFGHYVTLEDFTHISAYCFLNNCRIGRGTVVGLRSSIMNRTDTTHIPPYTNLMMNSVVTDSLPTTGTYLGKKRVNSDTSLQHRIL